MSARVLDLSGPEGNVYCIAAIAQAWNRQIGNDRPSILAATKLRLQKESDEDWIPHGEPAYNDVLDTFDLWFKDCIDYEFVNDPRVTGEEDYDWDPDEDYE